MVGDMGTISRTRFFVCLLTAISCVDCGKVCVFGPECGRNGARGLDGYLFMGGFSWAAYLSIYLSIYLLTSRVSPNLPNVMWSWVPCVVRAREARLKKLTKKLIETFFGPKYFWYFIKNLWGLYANPVEG